MPGISWDIESKSVWMTHCCKAALPWICFKFFFTWRLMLRNPYLKYPCKFCHWKWVLPKCLLKLGSFSNVIYLTMIYFVELLTTCKASWLMCSSCRVAKVPIVWTLQEVSVSANTQPPILPQSLWSYFTIHFNIKEQGGFGGLALQARNFTIHFVKEMTAVFLESRFKGIKYISNRT